MTRLLQADPVQLDAILDGTYPVWGEGLSRRAYGAWNRAQMATEWGRKHLHRMVLLDGDTLLDEYGAVLDGIEDMLDEGIAAPNPAKMDAESVTGGG